MGSKPLGDFAHRLNMLSATNLAAALRRKLLIATFFDIMKERHTSCCTKRYKQRLYLTDHPKTAVVSGYQISARGEHEPAFKEGQRRRRKRTATQTIGTTALPPCTALQKHSLGEHQIQGSCTNTVSCEPRLE
jgi:hypothetical protein